MREIKRERKAKKGTSAPKEKQQQKKNNKKQQQKKKLTSHTIKRGRGTEHTDRPQTSQRRTEKSGGKHFGKKKKEDKTNETNEGTRTKKRKKEKRKEKGVTFNGWF